MDHLTVIEEQIETSQGINWLKTFLFFLLLCISGFNAYSKIHFNIFPDAYFACGALGFIIACFILSFKIEQLTNKIKQHEKTISDITTNK